MHGAVSKFGNTYRAALAYDHQLLRSSCIWTKSIHESIFKSQSANLWQWERITYKWLDNRWKCFFEGNAAQYSWLLQNNADWILLIVRHDSVFGYVKPHHETFYVKGCSWIITDLVNRERHVKADSSIALLDCDSISIFPLSHLQLLKYKLLPTLDGNFPTIELGSKWSKASFSPRLPMFQV